jgi:ribose 5-phosphate isomerase A
MTIAQSALELIRDGDRVGLGTGRAATALVQALGAAVAQGLKVRCVPTSEATAALARELKIPLSALAELGTLDIALDGADEVDPALNMVKGLGGALVREKIVAASAQRLVILVGPEKLVPALGHRGRLPVEIIPFAEPLVTRRLAELGYGCQRRLAGAEPFVSDNGNWILDVVTTDLADPAEFEQALIAIPGVVDTGLFLGMADIVLIDEPSGTRRLERPKSR